MAIQAREQLSESDLNILQRIEEKHAQFKAQVESSKRFDQSEKDAANVDTREEFDLFWQKLSSTRENFDRDHETGCGLFGRRVQSGARSIQPFVAGFSPIIEMVKDVGAPFGGGAVGSVSLLFAVRNKDTRSAISSIQASLPGLKLYEQIYDERHELDKELQRQLVKVYQAFIIFCMSATQYYKRSGRYRWMRAFLPPNDLTDKEEELRGHIVNLRHRCEELLAKDVHTIKKDSQIIKKDNQIIKKDNQGLSQSSSDRYAFPQASVLPRLITDEQPELQQRLDHNKLGEVQRLLNLDGFSEEMHRKNWDKHCQMIYYDEAFTFPLCQQLRGLQLQAFKASSKYLAWKESNQSCLLILVGHNSASLENEDNCWLSPIPISTVEDLERATKKPIHAYLAFPSVDGSAFVVVPRILFQLLKQKSVVLRDETKYAELQGSIHRLQTLVKGQPTADGDKIQALVDVALQVVNFFDEAEELYIVVDRADRCRNLRGADHRKTLLRIFVQMVEAARCKLRILTVVDARYWLVEAARDELGETRKNRVIMHTMEQQYFET
ncbi:MAG: hypothetical protein Q9184_005848 [Pyrenodesmia sp. 2 TL-2023]